MLLKKTGERNILLPALLILTALLLTTACSLSGLSSGNDETLAALSTKNAALAAELAVQQTAVAELAGETRLETKSPSDPPATEDPTSSMQVTGSWVSPDGTHTALVLEEHLLVVEDVSGTRQVLFESEAITGLSWFPDGSAIAISDRIEDASSPLQVRDRLLLIDTAGGQASVLTDGFAPAVSPDGEWVAFYAGIQYGDACSVGWQLGFLLISPSGAVVQTVLQDDFTGLPGAEFPEAFYPSPADPPSNPGEWISSEQFESFFRWACVEQPGEDGVYLFDLDTMTA